MADWAQIARRIRVPLGFAFAILYIWLAKPTLEFFLIGMIVTIPGILLRASASGYVKKNESLATTGPYAYTRNPLYLGSLIIAIGFALAARSWWTAAILLVFFVSVYVPVIHGEEKFLRSRFPEFEKYASEVPRLLPRLTSCNAGQGSFSWELYKKHREYNAVIGSLVLWIALIAKISLASH